jgi:hypothetical membrane protein
MNQKFLSSCGVIAPVLFVFMTILGGAIRPGYSHIKDTVSELFSPGAPNTRLLVPIHFVYALLITLFGFGVLQFVRGSEHSMPIGLIGAWMIIAMGVLNVTTATVFPQDAWGSPSTFPGEMHKILVGLLALLSIISTLLIGIWVSRTGIFSGFSTYTFITVGVLILIGGFAAVKLGTPIMGLTERIAILVGLQWIFILAMTMFLR